jgi:hypothetical protein
MKAGSGPTLVLALSTVLIVVGLALPTWYTIRVVSEAQTADGKWVARVPDGQLSYSRGEWEALPTTTDNVVEVAEDFDCTIGFGLWQYNAQLGSCYGLDEVSATFKKATVNLTEPQRANFNSLYDSFGTTSYVCDLGDPNNEEFVAQPDNVVESTRAPTPMGFPTFPPTPKTEPSVYEEARFQKSCTQLYMLQILPCFAVIFSLVASVSMAVATCKESPKARKVALISAFLAGVFGLTTTQFYEHTNQQEGVVDVLSDQLGSVVNDLRRQWQLAYLIPLDEVDETLYGSGFGCFLAGVVFAGLGWFLMLVGGEAEGKAVGSNV